MWLLYFVFGLLAASMAPLIHPITGDLGISHSTMGGVLGAWPLVYIAVAIPCGALLDRFGTRRMLFLAAMILCVSGALRATATGPLSLFLGVAVFGLGGPLISIGLPKLISQWFEGPERGFAMGIYVSGPALGAVAALSLTNSALMPFLGDEWRNVLLLYAGAAMAAGLVWILVSAHPASRAVEADAAAQPRRRSREVFGNLLRLRPVRIMLVMAVFIFFFNHGLNNWLPEILRSNGMDAIAAGYWASIPTAVGVAAALLIPRFAIPQRRIAILLALFLSASVATQLLHSQVDLLLALGLVCQGIARGSMMAVATLTLVEMREVGPQYAGAAGGLFFSCAEIGGVLGPLTLGVVHDLTGGFDTALNLLTGICLFLILLLGCLRKSQRE